MRIPLHKPEIKRGALAFDAIEQMAGGRIEPKRAATSETEPPERNRQLRLALGPQARRRFAALLFAERFAHFKTKFAVAFAVSHRSMVAVTGRPFKAGLPAGRGGRRLPSRVRAPDCFSRQKSATLGSGFPATEGAFRNVALRLSY